MGTSPCRVALLVALYAAAIVSPLIGGAAAHLTADGLDIEVTRASECSRKSRNGDTLGVHYYGTLGASGKKFDTSFGDAPLTFVLGKGEVIFGWDHGLVDMCIGEGRRLTIPPALAYGNKRRGGIPANSTLIFETLLVSVKDVGEAAPSVVAEVIARVKSSMSAHTNRPKPEQQKITASENGECRLLGPFAILIQAALGTLALLSLVWKRWRETPRRPLKVWSFDVSKQVFGSCLLHIANLFMAMLSSGKFDVTMKAAAKEAHGGDASNQPNPCSFYLLNLAIDTTIGIPILVILLRLLHYGAALTPLARPAESLKSGNYGEPPKATWWFKQSILYFLALLGMKTCVFILFQLLPWIAWVGGWALRWTEGNEAIQITFVMFIFPLIMNGMQYYIIDSFIKEKDGGSSGHELIPDEDEDGEGLLDGDDDEAVAAFGSEDEDDEVRKGSVNGKSKELTTEANPTPVPIRSERGNRTRAGAGQQPAY